MRNKHRSNIVVEWREKAPTIEELEHRRDHWLTVATEAEASRDWETRDLSLCAAEEAEQRLSAARIGLVPWTA